MKLGGVLGGGLEEKSALLLAGNGGLLAQGHG